MGDWGEILMSESRAILRDIRTVRVRKAEGTTIERCSSSKPEGAVLKERDSCGAS